MQGLEFAELGLKLGIDVVARPFALVRAVTFLQMAWILVFATSSFGPSSWRAQSLLFRCCHTSSSWPRIALQVGPGINGSVGQQPSRTSTLGW